MNYTKMDQTNFEEPHVKQMISVFRKEREELIIPDKYAFRESFK